MNTFLMQGELRLRQALQGREGRFLGWAGSQRRQCIGRQSVGRKTGGRRATTVSGGGRQTKLQADRGEAIGRYRAYAGKGGGEPGWNLGGGGQGDQGNLRGREQ